MVEINNKIVELSDKLENLMRAQEHLSKEMIAIKKEINSLLLLHNQLPLNKEAIIEDKIILTPEENSSLREDKTFPPPKPEGIDIPVFESQKNKSNIEKFIGENLINKIGILIIIAGIAIGAKYAISRDLISPATRIIIGYLSGIVLIGFAFRLRKRYENYSSVLMGGGLAILYFITYFAYSYYHLLPQAPAFMLMAVFTGFTVATAINYNREIIAHIGMVGAYAVPFLLGENSGNVVILFIYMTIINIGIFITAFKKYWKKLYYLSFFFTWTIFIGWYFVKYNNNDFNVAFLFSTLFFILFYITFLTYRLVKKEKFIKADIIPLLFNSFIYYSIGTSILNNNLNSDYIGLFTSSIAVFHFMISAVFYYKDETDKNLLYLTSGLGLIFITIAIPVQLEGNWVTLLWAGEAALLFWIGRSKNAPVYELMSYPLMLLAFGSIIIDWTNNYAYMTKPPIINIYFLSSILFITAFYFINRIQQIPINTEIAQRKIVLFMEYAISAILIMSIYFTLFAEISGYFNYAYSSAFVNYEFPITDIHTETNLLRPIWLMVYTSVFLTVLTILHSRKYKPQLFPNGILVLSSLTILVFLIAGTIQLKEIRDHFYDLNYKLHYYGYGSYFLVRYLAIISIMGLFIANHQFINQHFANPFIIIAFDCLFHISLIVILSDELLHWMQIFDVAQSDKLVLSVLWGIYALLLIILGIIYRKKHLRIQAIALVGITLVKLFLYDLTTLDTIAKTIVFVTLGILLLIMSFLYNKYKATIFNES